MQSIVQDLRFAARRLIKDRWFTLAAFVALALGIGANSAVFTLVNAVMLRGLPVNNPDRIMWLDTHDTRGRNFGVSLQDFEDWRDASHTFSGMSLVFNGSMNLSADDRVPEQYVGVYISANGFDLIGQKAALGRSFGAEDDRKGAPPVVLLGSSVWKSRYAGDPGIIGKAVRVNALPVTVIGVMPEGLKWPFSSDVWMPMAQLPPALAQQGRAARFMFAYGRLGDGVTIEQARSEMSSISAQLSTEHQDTNKDISAVVTPFNDRVIGRQIRTVFWALMGAVAFVLLIACSNVANLLLARAAGRSREIAVRVSLGATRWRIVRQLMVESLLLAVISGIAGLAIAYAGIRWFDGETQNVGKPYWMTFDMDARVFAFFAVVCVLTGIIFGIAPALHISKTNVNEVLKEGGRSGTGIRARRWTAALIVAELTLTLVLLTGAGFMMRSFLNLYRMDLGIETSHLLTMSIILPARKYPTPQDEVTILRRIDERLSAVGALAGAATTTNQPLQGGAGRQLTIDGKTAAAGDKPTTVTLLSVGPGYFDAVGVRLLRGRTFDPTTDGTPGHEMAIVNQRLVAMYFPGEDPIGKRIRLSDDSPGGRPSAWTTIIGLAPNIRQRSGQDPDPDPVVYVPHLQNPTMGRGVSIIVRGRSEPGQLTAQLRKEIFAVDPDMPLANIRTMEENLAQQRWFVRVFGTMFSVFAAIAIVLATVGLYAVTAYSVTQRTQEIGVRMALGAQPGQVRWLILRQGLIQLAIGLVLGLAGAFGVGKVLQSASILVQTGPTDIVTMASTTLLLVVVGLTACLWPARQATRLNPVTALRYE